MTRGVMRPSVVVTIIALLATFGLVLACDGARGRGEEPPSRSAAEESALVDTAAPHDHPAMGALEVRTSNSNPHDSFDVLQNGIRAFPGNPRLLNTILELPPGTYEVDVNRTRLTVSIEAGRKISVWVGELIVEGGPQGAFWYPEDAGERRVTANPPVLNSGLALFPGSYTVFVYSGVDRPVVNLGTVEVVGGETKVLQHAPAGSPIG